MSCSKVLRQAMLPLGLLLGFGLLACQPLPEQPVPEASVPTESAPGESGFDPAAIRSGGYGSCPIGRGPAAGRPRNRVLPATCPLNQTWPWWKIP